MRALITKDGIVANIAKFADGSDLPQGWQIAPDTIDIGWTDNGNGNFSAPVRQDPPTEPPKAIRDKSLASLVYDFGDGRIIQTRPKDEQNIRNAIEIMNKNNMPAISWVMANDVKHPITAAELQTALSHGQMAAMAIWDDYIPITSED